MGPGLCRSQSRSHTSHNTESSPDHGGGHQIQILDLGLSLLHCIGSIVDIRVIVDTSDLRVMKHL